MGWIVREKEKKMEWAVGCKNRRKRKERKKEGKKGGKRERIKRREKEKKGIIGEKEGEGRKLVVFEFC